MPTSRRVLTGLQTPGSSYFSLRYRPVWGQILEVPFSGIKRVSLIEPQQEGEVQTLQIELLVGGELRVPLDVRNSEEVAERVRAAVQAYRR